MHARILNLMHADVHPVNTHTRAVPANSGPVRNNGLGPSGLVKDHEYQAIPVGKRDMLCESTNVRSHTSAMCCVKAQMLEVTRVIDS